MGVAEALNPRRISVQKTEKSTQTQRRTRREGGGREACCAAQGAAEVWGPRRDASAVPAEGKHAVDT